MSIIRYMAQLIRAIVVSLLPKRYRGKWSYEHTADFLTAAFISGILEFLLSIVILSGRYFDEIRQAPISIGGPSVNLETAASLNAHLEMFRSFAFILNPFHSLLYYFFLEGMVRALAVLTTHEALGTLPLYLVAGIQDWIGSRLYKRSLGPPIADEIVPGDRITHDMCIRSSRPKPEWNTHITVRFRDEFYMLVAEESGSKPRPFVYRLRRNPENRPVVVVLEYHSS